MSTVKHRDLTGDDLHENKPHTHPASEIGDFGAQVSAQSDVVANTAARHSHANKAQLDLVTDGDHDVRTDNPHAVTKSQVGLRNVTNDAQLKIASNLSDVTSVSTARANLKLTTGGASTFVVAPTGGDYTDIHTAEVVALKNGDKLVAGERHFIVRGEPQKVENRYVAYTRVVGQEAV